MELSQGNDKLLYIKLADWITDEILAGTFPEGSQIPSVAELSTGFKMNHITTLKGIGLLADAGIIFKKRGIGMYVAEGATQKIRSKRREEFYGKYILAASIEAKKLGIPLEELLHLTEKGYEQE